MAGDSARRGVFAPVAGCCASDYNPPCIHHREKFMSRIASFVCLLAILAGCSSTPAAHNPYGSADGQRERAGKATQELGGY